MPSAGVAGESTRINCSRYSDCSSGVQESVLFLGDLVFTESHVDLGCCRCLGYPVRDFVNIIVVRSSALERRAWESPVRLQLPYGRRVDEFERDLR